MFRILNPLTAVGVAVVVKSNIAPDMAVKLLFAVVVLFAVLEASDLVLRHRQRMTAIARGVQDAASASAQDTTPRRF